MTSFGAAYLYSPDSAASDRLRKLRGGSVKRATLHKPDCIVQRLRFDLVAAGAAFVIPRQMPIHVDFTIAGYLHERRMAHCHRRRRAGRVARVVHEERSDTNVVSVALFGSYRLHRFGCHQWFKPLSRRRAGTPQLRTRLRGEISTRASPDH
ncbi:hypothetical protein PSAB6_50216 [Paraburkholderia sabiae]|nr:hypothetical protein PSAB6_50216 [Paraburkholderia sabiae]